VVITLALLNAIGELRNMPMLHTLQTSYEPMRSADVTADDTLIDPSGSAGNWLTDFTSRDVYELGPETNGVEIIFWAEADETDYFGCKLWGGAVGTPSIAEFICDMSGQAGAAIADVTNPDNTSRLFVDYIYIFDQAHIDMVGLLDSSRGNNRIAKLAFDTYGYKFLYPEFYTVGDTTEVHRTNAYLRKM